MTKTEKWNPLDFQCRMGCSYCPEKGHSKTPELRDAWKAIPEYFAIWVCEDTDLFAPEVPDDIIKKVLKRASESRRSTCIFCTKNPVRYFDFIDDFPRDAMLAITVESDIDHHCSKAPPPLVRLELAGKLRQILDSRRENAFVYRQLCLSIQPMMPFTYRFAELIREVKPHQVSIGYELLGLEGFPTPEFSKVMELSNKLIGFSEVNINGFPYDTDFDDWPYRPCPEEFETDSEILRARKEKAVIVI